MPTRDIKKFGFIPFAGNMRRLFLKERMKKRRNERYQYQNEYKPKTSNENDAYEIDTVMPREDKCVCTSRTHRFFKSQQITNKNNNNHLLL